MLLDKDDEHSICVRCGSHGWMVIAWPDNKAEIETELLKMTADKKNSYDSDIDRDLIGDHGIIELRTDLVNNGGGLRVPRLTTAQRTAQTTTNGTHVYDTTEDRVYRYEDGAWVASDDLTHQVLSGFTQGDILICGYVR